MIVGWRHGATGLSLMRAKIPTRVPERPTHDVDLDYDFWV